MLYVAAFFPEAASPTLAFSLFALIRANRDVDLHRSSIPGQKVQGCISDSKQETNTTKDSTDFLYSAIVSAPPTSVSPTDWIQDLSLMHHFCTSTYNTISSRQCVSQLWQREIPLRATEYPFLMHALLALSASHLSYLRPDDHRKYATISSHHQNLVFAAFRSAMLDVTPKNFTAVFAVAAILSILSMTVISLPVEKHHNDPVASVDDILQSFVFTRGVRDVLRPAWGWIRDSPVSVMIEGNVLPNYDHHGLPAPIQTRLDDLSHMLQELCDLSALSPCSVALSELEKIFKDVLFLNTGIQLETGVIIKWMVAVPTDFVSLIRSRSTVALVLLGHFIILFDLLKMKWHIHSWSKRALLAIKFAIPEDERRWLAWPEEQLKRGLPAFQLVD